MSVKVPISKAAVVGQKSARARKDQRARAEFKRQQSTIPLPTSDLQYLKNIHDQGRFVHTGNQQANQTQVLATIIPPEGTTFYFLGGFCRSSIAAGSTFRLRVVIDGVTTVLENVFSSLTTGTYVFDLPFGSVVGNGVNAWEIHFTDSGNDTGNAAIWGYFADTPQLGRSIMIV